MPTDHIFKRYHWYIVKETIKNDTEEIGPQIKILYGRR